MGSGKHTDSALLAVDTMIETSDLRKHPESGPVLAPPSKPAPKLRTWQRRLLFLSIALILIAAFMPRIYILNKEYTALCCSNEAYDTLTEESTTVTLRLRGIYLSPPFGNDRYYGTLHILDYPKEGKTSGGKFEPLELGRLWRNVHTGGLWYYSEKRSRYESLGLIFWDVSAEQIFIHTEDDYIVYPAQTVADMNALWVEITAH